MKQLWQARFWQVSSNPVAVWWGFLGLAGSTNIVLWCLLYTYVQSIHGVHGAGEISLMLGLCAAYVFGCAFRSFLPRADVQRICLYDSWLSSVVVGRSVATIAEMSFAAQWALVLMRLAEVAGTDTPVSIAWAIVPLIAIAQCCSWYGVLTTNYLANAIENSIWAVAFFLVGIALSWLLPEFDGIVRVAIVVALLGIAAFLAFLIAVDVPMYLNRWRDGGADGGRNLNLRDGLRDARTRWVVTHDIAHWRGEIAWMSLYFTVAVWASLALCLGFSLGHQATAYQPTPVENSRADVVESAHNAGPRHATVRSGLILPAR